MGSDRELAERFATGDAAAVTDVYARFGGAVHTVARSIVGDGDAADVVQATFLNAWRAAERFDPARALSPWLYAIARRQAIDHLRRTRRTTATDPDAFDRLGSERDDTTLERTWEDFQVRVAVDALPDDERQLVRLHWFEGLTHVEIAERIGVPVGTVKSRSHRAHRRLATSLTDLSPNRDGAADVQLQAAGRPADDERVHGS